MEDDLKRKTTSNGRQPRLLKVEYLSNYWSHISQISNLSLNYQIFQKTISNGRLPQMEDYLKY